MASSEPIQVSSLPLPPMQYINQYTDEMIRRGRSPRPPPPIHDTYHMFGNSFNTEESIIRPLESQVNISPIVLTLSSWVCIVLHFRDLKDCTPSISTEEEN